MKKIIFLFAFVLPVICMGQKKTDVLYIIDGVVADSVVIAYLNPIEIESIDVLGDKSFSPGFDSQHSEVILIVTKLKYEATVFDPGFDSFLATQQPKEFYSEANLKSKNTLMVAEWNYRYNQPFRHDPQIYEVKIDYESDIDYGLEVEYKLYMFFKFMEKQYKISLTI